MAKKPVVTEYEILQTLEVVAQLTLQDGYVPKIQGATGNRPPTAQVVQQHFLSDSPSTKVDVSSGAKRLAVEVLEWLKAKFVKPNVSGGFEETMKAILTHNTIHQKHLGFIAWSVEGFLKEQQKLKDAKHMPVSQHVGEVGKAIGITVEVTKIKDMHSYFIVEGVSKDDQISWFQSNEPQFKSGDVVKVTAFVKAHGDFRGQKTTTLTRVKVKT